MSNSNQMTESPSDREPSPRSFLSRLGAYLDHKRASLFLAIFLIVVPFLVRRKSYRSIAWLLEQSISCSARGRPLPGTRRSYKVIFLIKSVFIDDVMNGLAPRGRFDLYQMDRRLIKAIVRPFLPYGVSDNTYQSDDPQMMAGKAAARDFLDRLIEEWISLYPFDAMITGNIVYWAEQELAGELDRRGVAFVACHKESIQAPDIYKELMELRREGNDPFQGTLALVYNHKTLEQLVDGNMVPRDKIAVTGTPRIDRFHQWRLSEQPHRERPLVVCLLISLISQMRCLIDPTDERRWKRISGRTHQALFELASEHPDIDFIVKYKISDKWQIEAIKKQFEGRIPGNVSFTALTDLFDLLKNASVIIGHNTTAIFEAISIGKICIIPHYEEALETDYQGRLLDYGSAVIRVESPETLKKLILKTIKMPQKSGQLTDEKRRLLIEWVGNADGRASERMEHGICAAIQSKRSDTPVDLAAIEERTG